MEEIDKNKEEIKGEIQKVFTKIREELNNREDQLLIEVDQIYEKKYNSKYLDNILKEKKLDEKIKIFIDKGKTAEKEWDKYDNKIILINDCINIEKAIDKINNININIDNYKSQDKKLKFYSHSDDIIYLIKKLGTFDKKINEQEVCININNFNPQNLNCLRQISSNFGCYDYDAYDCICFFISKNNEHVLCYPDSSYKSLIFYDINNNNEIKKINNAHDNNIYTIKHYTYDKFDIILSTSYNNDIKIWNYNEGLNILTISKIYENDNYVFSSCIIFGINNFTIFCTGYQNYIKIYNQAGEFIKNIGNNDAIRFYIDSSEIEDKKYLLVGGSKGIQVFNLPALTEYHTFIEGNDGNRHNEAKIIKINDTYNLIDTGNFNHIKIWDFVNKNLINKINSDTTNYNLRGFMIINNRYLIIGSNDKNIKEFDLEKKIMIKSINKHNNYVVGIKPVKDKNGNIFIISYSKDKNIYLWGFN